MLSAALIYNDKSSGSESGKARELMKTHAFRGLCQSAVLL